MDLRPNRDVLGVQEVVGSNPAVPTFSEKKPFGQKVEGLSYFRDESCAVERAVQTHDFEDSTLCIVTGGNRMAPV
jgi:hypothetical protein